MLDRREPTAGSSKTGHGVVTAYFSQHEIELDESLTVLGMTQSATGLNRPEAQNLLGKFLFSGWEMHERQVGALSGGERRRLALALVVASGANFLVLDEPTNHLDLESREALEGALDAFPGTVLLVSHDRALLDAVAHRTLAVEDQPTSSRTRAAGPTTPRPEPSGSRPRPLRRRRREKPAKPAKPARTPQKLTQLETDIEKQQRLVEKLEAKLAEDWTDVDTIAAHKRARDDLADMFERWEAMVDEVAR